MDSVRFKEVFLSFLSDLVFVVLTFEVGVLLVILPWTDYWTNNWFLFLLTERFPKFNPTFWVENGYVRGGVAGLGLTNLVLSAVETTTFIRRWFMQRRSVE